MKGSPKVRPSRSKVFSVIAGIIVAAAMPLSLTAQPTEGTIELLANQFEAERLRTKTENRKRDSLNYIAVATRMLILLDPA